MDKNKLLLPISILLAAIILGGFFYLIEIKKQKSIEKQQMLKLEMENIEKEQKAEKEKQDKIFSNQVKCSSLLNEYKRRWYNVVGMYYDETLNTCIVKYTKNGKVYESPMEEMHDIR